MTPEQIKEALESRGWTASIVRADDVDDLVPVEKGHLMKCVDGRESDHDGMRGPKTLGGIYAIASLRGVTDPKDLADIVKEVAKAGYGPSVHGDEGAGTMGCGYYKLWRNGDLTNLKAPDFEGDEGKKAVVDAGGEYETLLGGHAETEVVINLVPDTTLEPKKDQRFVVDAWVIGTFELDAGQYLTLAAETVEKLTTKNPLRTARIVVPGQA